MKTKLKKLKCKFFFKKVNHLKDLKVGHYYRFISEKDSCEFQYKGRTKYSQHTILTNEGDTYSLLESDCDNGYIREI